ncbi:MAG: peptidoglycan DD-metalloendopeptidase family protein [Alphaproteobacteria bacterium]|nr:peptidoglycan DD-metalloendopeptidase family protein [Alphaproteobacteria bacterium]
MSKFFLFLCCLFYSQATLADTLRQEITGIKKQKEVLNLEKKRLLEESDSIEKMIQDLARVSEEKKENHAKHQIEISKTLPLLARLERSNPLRIIIDPATGQYKARGIILMRFFISSIKNKMQQIKIDLNDINVRTSDLAIKNQLTRHLLQEIERRKEKLSLVENKKIETWTKAERDRLDKEEDSNTLLDESRETLSKTTKVVSEATALKGLPFRRLEKPVAGKSFNDITLQNKFSPHSIGIFFETKKNARVCAPAKGRVVFKGPFRNHAEILIIDHGETTHTILMGMHKIDAEVGKNVYAGQKLGTMASYGSGHLSLYLELRHKGESIDPAPYFAMKNLE